MSSYPWPLPLAAFEEYMLRDDSPRYPMSIIARLTFKGQLDRAAANEVLEAVFVRHPLLRAKVHNKASGRLEWIAADGPLAIQFVDGPVIDRLPAMRPIDLYAEAGIKLWLAADSQASSVVLQVHHAVCDGKAVLQILDEFMRGYARLMNGPATAPDLPLCEPRALPLRGNFGLTVWSYLQLLPAQLMGMSRVWKFFVQRPVALLKASATKTDCPTGNFPANDIPATRAGSLEPWEVERLSAAAASAKVTVNDWLLRDFFRAVDEFRARHQPAVREGWVRVTVPINMRRGGDRGMSAANEVSMVFVDRKPRHIASANLLRGIHEEMDTVRRRWLGLLFIEALWIVRRLPGGMARWINRDGCDSTCVLSNVGRAMDDSPLPRTGGKIQAGTLLLEGVDFFSPVRVGTAVNAALLYYAGGLQICIQYDRGRVTEAQADDLIATYLRTIRGSLDAADHTPLGRAA